MEIRLDGNGSKYIEWEQSPGIFKRAWIQHRDRGSEKDWAGSGRYLLVVRCQKQGRTGGNATDFPIFNELPDEQILLAFVYGVNAITGCAPVDN